MSYKTYTTEGVVCGSISSNTSDKGFLIFTKEAGMLWASARSVREERSKQRYALQDFSRIRVSLVKGKSGWRIGSVESLGNPFLSAATRAQRGRVSFVISQLRRFVQGETTLPRIYADVNAILEAVCEEEERWNVLRLTFLLRLLSDLGYISNAAPFRELLSAQTLEEAAHFFDPKFQALIEERLEEASRASHL